MLGRTLLIFTGAVVVVGITVFLIVKWRRGANTRDDAENAADYRDAFHRARSMGQDAAEQPLRLPKGTCFNRGMNFPGE